MRIIVGVGYIIFHLGLIYLAYQVFGTIDLAYQIFGAIGVLILFFVPVIPFCFLLYLTYQLFLSE
jgi:hypothetical protein